MCQTVGTVPLQLMGLQQHSDRSLNLLKLSASIILLSTITVVGITIELLGMATPFKDICTTLNSINITPTSTMS